MNCKVDRRTIRFERDDEALAEAAARREAWLDSELSLARLFCRIDRKAAYVRQNCASISEFGAQRGYDGQRVRQLALLGYALDGLDGLEDAIRAKRIAFIAAWELGRIFSNPLYLAEGDDWLNWATLSGLKAVRRRIRERIEAVRQEVRKARTFTAAVSDRTRENLERCRLLASKAAREALTCGQLLDVLSMRYLCDEDPTLVEPRARRMPDTAGLLDARGVAADVVREIWLRSGGLCEFGCCDHPIAQLCHTKPHRDGSPREPRDLVGGCTLHHKQYDKGWMRLTGWTDDGLPVFLTVETREFLVPKPRPERRDDWDLPEWLLRALGPKRRKKLERLRKRARTAAESTSAIPGKSRT